MAALTKIPYLTVVFRNELKSYEIPAFRGAVISKVPPELTLFHNHVGSGFRFSYPLIQYKTIGGKAAIVCLGEGTRDIESFFTSSDFHLFIGDREDDFTVENVWANQWILQPWTDSFRYSIRHWLPLNSENYQSYLSMEGVVERTQFLDSILVGNILSMSKGLGVFFEKPVTCKIVSVDRGYCQKYKGVALQAFDLQFITNVFVPDYVGLGKGVSAGFGTIKRMKSSKEQRYDGNE